MEVSERATPAAEKRVLMTGRSAVKAAERGGDSRRLDRRRLFVASMAVAMSSAFSLAICVGISTVHRRADGPTVTAEVELVATARAEKYLAAVRASNDSVLNYPAPCIFRLDCRGPAGKYRCLAKADQQDEDVTSSDIRLPLASEANGNLRVLYAGYYYVTVQLAATAANGSAGCVEIALSRKRYSPDGGAEDVLSVARATLENGVSGRPASVAALYVSKLSVLERGDGLSVQLQCSGSSQCQLSVGHASYLSLYLVAAAP